MENTLVCVLKVILATGFQLFALLSDYNFGVFKFLYVTKHDGCFWEFINTVFPQIIPWKLFFFEFSLIYCDLWPQYIQVQKPFKGGNYSRVESIRGNTV